MGGLAGEKYGAAAQKILIPTIAEMMRKFMVDNSIEDESTAIGKEIMPLIESVERLLAMHPMTQTTQIHPLLKLYLL